MCDTLGPLDVRVDPVISLWGEIHVGDLGAVRIAQIKTRNASSVHRTAGLIRSGGPDVYRVVLPFAGTHYLRQGGRAARLSSGSLSIYDFTRPYEIAYTSAVELGVLSIPRALLPLPVDAVAKLTAVPVTGAGALVAPLLRQVARDLDTYRPAAATRLGPVLVDLITVALAGHADLPAADSQHRTLLVRILAFVEQHLADSELSPRAVASAHHISLRHLHRLFAAEGTTVSAWIRQRRLERCRKDLADASLRSLPVAAVAATWGLPDAAQFSRSFRNAFGMTPTEYRRNGH